MVSHSGVEFNFLVPSVKRCWFEWKVKSTWDITLLLNWNLLIKTNINLNRPVVHRKIVRHMRDGGSWHSSHGWFHTGKIRSLSNKSIIAEVTIPAAVTIPSVITPVGNDHFTAPHWNICPKAARLPEYRF